MQSNNPDIQFTHKKSELYNILWTVYPVSNEYKYTHTSINDPKGSWHIPDQNLESFYKFYVSFYYKYNINIHLTEKHKSVSPILIDLDFKYLANNNNRKFNDKFIKDIIKLYNKIIKETYLDITDELLESYVMLKNNPLLNNKNGVEYYKDGIHIIYPFIVTKPEHQKWMRYDLLNNYKKELDIIFQNFKCMNTYEDIFDEKVIFDTNWQLYGSLKPNNIKYILNKIYDYNCIEKENIYKEYTEENELKLITLFSIRNKSETKLILNQKNNKMNKWINSEEVERFINKTKIKNINNLELIKSEKRNISDLTIYGQVGQDFHIKYIEELVLCLNSKRADNYDTWTQTGILLHNIDYRLLDIWIKFSKQSSKFIQGECENIWDMLPTFKNKNDNSSNKELNIGSLFIWCKNDNETLFYEIQNKHFRSIEGPLNKLLYNSISLGHTDIADVVYTYFNGYGISSQIKFLCYNIPKKLFCEYDNKLHRWIEDTEESAGNCIRSKFNKEISKLYKVDYSRYLTNKIEEAMEQDDQQEEQRLTEIKKKLGKLEQSLKITSFRDTLLKECAARFWYPDARSRFDTQNELICFANGIYDLDANVFRNGKPDDFISITTNINYNKYKYDSPEMIKLIDILKKILPIDAVREYFLLILSTCLSGKIWFEKFFVLTGTGANGKSKLLEFINNCFGQYFHQMNVAALCSKRGSSTQADPELAMLRAKRIVIFQEPTKNEPINVGKLKEWTGGDSIQTRELYKGPVKFKPQAKWFLICNDIPDIPSDDDGTWRRLTIINFPSKFVSPQDYSGREFEYIGDPNIGLHLDELKDVFMSLLIDKYQTFKHLMSTSGLIEPDEVKLSTENERKKNNPMKQFFDEKIIFSDNPDDIITLVNTYTNFKDFMIDNNYPLKSIPRREDFKMKLNNFYPSIIKKNLSKNIKVSNNLTSWSNLKIITSNDNSTTNFNTIDNNNTFQNTNIILSDTESSNSDSDSDSD